MDGHRLASAHTAAPLDDVPKRGGITLSLNRPCPEGRGTLASTFFQALD